MRVQTHKTAREFLNAALAQLEYREAENGLILGICGQLKEHPERFQHPVCLKTVAENGVPILAAIMTPPHKLLLAGQAEDWEESALALVDSLVREGWKIPGVTGPTEIARVVTARLAASGGKRYRLDHSLRMYELEDVMLPAPSRGRLRAAAAADLELISSWWQAASVEMFGKADPEESRQRAAYRLGDGDVYVWEDGEPVSMASKVRPTKRGISIGMVYTPPERRRNGYATACVGELSRMLLREGHEFCTLYADLSNPISNNIYQKIGYRPIGDIEEYGFVEED